MDYNAGMFAAGKAIANNRWSVIGEKQGVEFYPTKQEALDRIAALKAKNIKADLYDSAGEAVEMLPPTIVCAICHRASEGHDRNGACVTLRRNDRQAAPMTPAGYATLRGMVREYNERNVR